MATPCVLHTLARFSCSTCTDDVPLARTFTNARYVAASDLPAVGVEGLIPTGKKKKKSKGKGDATGPEYGLQGRMNARLITLDEQHRCGQLCCWSVTISNVWQVHSILLVLRQPSWSLHFVRCQTLLRVSASPPGCTAQHQAAMCVEVEVPGRHFLGINVPATLYNGVCSCSLARAPCNNSAQHACL